MVKVQRPTSSIPHGGFILLEMLISALILASAVAVSMYLFRTGFSYLEKVSQNNLLSSKVPQAITYLQTEADLTTDVSEVPLGSGVTLTYKAKLLERVKPQIELPEAGLSTPYELSLYEVDFELKWSNLSRSYRLYILRHRMLTLGSEPI